jgi:hypothetical protein
MPATVTTLDRAIHQEERFVGIPTDRPLTDRTIAHRRFQIAILLLACGFAALCAVFAASGLVQMPAVALAGGFGLYALRQDRHLRRLALLRGDSRRITLAVAEELLFSGALAGDRELLDLRAAAASRAGSLAAGLSDVVPCECTRVRLVGPSGEVPLAAMREIALRRPIPDDPEPARQALRVDAPVRQSFKDRMIIVVPMWRGEEPIALLEVISAPGDRYRPLEVALIDAFAQGAVAALRG